MKTLHTIPQTSLALRFGYKEKYGDSWPSQLSFKLSPWQCFQTIPKKFSLVCYPLHVTLLLKQLQGLHLLLIYSNFYIFISSISKQHHNAIDNVRTLPK
jgi:hypothetical protein